MDHHLRSCSRTSGRHGHDQHHGPQREIFPNTASDYSIDGVTVSTAHGGGNSVTLVLLSTVASGTDVSVVADSVQNPAVGTYPASAFSVDTSQTTTPVNPTGPLSFVTGPASASVSQLSVTPGVVTANGTATAVVTVVLADAAGNPISGRTITLSQGSAGSTISPASAVTGSSGSVSFSVTDTKVETVTYTAVDQSDGLTLLSTVSVNFVHAPPPPPPFFHLVVPPGASAVHLTVSSLAITGTEAAQLLQKTVLPKDVQPLGVFLQFSAETPSGSPVTSVAQELILTVDLSALSGITDSAQVGVFYLNPNGTLTFVGGQLQDGKLLAQLPRFGTYFLGQVNVSFPDLGGYSGAGDVNLLASKYIVFGMPDGNVNPLGQVTRAEFMVMLVRALSLTGAAAGVGSAQNPRFSDVNPKAWFVPDMNVAIADGLIQGYPDGTFRPDAPVTRLAAAAMLARAITFEGKAPSLSAAEVQSILVPFTDRDLISTKLQAAVALLIQMDILKGETDHARTERRAHTG